MEAIRVGRKDLLWKKWEDLGHLSAENLEVLRSIECPDRRYVPASALLRNGESLSCVVFIERGDAQSFGFFPWSEYFKPANPFRARKFFRFDPSLMTEATEVVTIGPSPQKIPIAVERKMRDNGPNHMMGYAVMFVLADGTEFWHAGTESTDFVSVPAGHSAKEIVDVRFDTAGQAADRSRQKLVAPDIKVCVFAGT